MPVTQLPLLLPVLLPGYTVTLSAPATPCQLHSYSFCSFYYLSVTHLLLLLPILLPGYTVAVFIPSTPCHSHSYSFCSFYSSCWPGGLQGVWFSSWDATYSCYSLVISAILCCSVRFFWGSQLQSAVHSWWYAEWRWDG